VSVVRHHQYPSEFTSISSVSPADTLDRREYICGWVLKRLMNTVGIYSDDVLEHESCHEKPYFMKAN
jgi:hypothetical protein